MFSILFLCNFYVPKLHDKLENVSFFHSIVSMHVVILLIIFLIISFNIAIIFTQKLKKRKSIKLYKKAQWKRDIYRTLLSYVYFMYKKINFAYQSTESLGIFSFWLEFSLYNFNNMIFYFQDVTSLLCRILSRRYQLQLRNVQQWMIWKPNWRIQISCKSPSKFCQAKYIFENYEELEGIWFLYKIARSTIFPKLIVCHPK